MIAFLKGLQDTLQMMVVVPQRDLVKIFEFKKKDLYLVKYLGFGKRGLS